MAATAASSADQPTVNDTVDYTDGVIPEGKRKSTLRMTATFASLLVTFPTILVGYGARFAGLSLGQLTVALALAAVVMTAYCIGSANVGAVVGQTYTVTARSVLGRFGSGLVSFLVLIPAMGFYVFNVLFIVTLADALHWHFLDAGIATAALAFVMIVNNYFGFRGLQAFAQYVAMPIIIAWGIYATILSLVKSSPHLLAHPPATHAPESILFVAGVMIGYATWGNEPDIFRYAKRGRASWWNVPAVSLSYLVAVFIFPIMGYNVAALANTSDQSAGIRYFAHLTTFGLAPLLLVILLINMWSLQDGTLYAPINAAQNLLSGVRRWRRAYTVIGLGLVGALFTFEAPSVQTLFYKVTGVSGDSVPVASSIVIMDIFLLPRLFGLRRPLHRVPAWRELAPGNWPGIAGIVIGTLVGAGTNGLIPGFPGYGTTYIGLPPLQGWITGVVVYLVGVSLVYRRADARAILGYPAIGEEDTAASVGEARAPASGDDPRDPTRIVSA